MAVKFNVSVAEFRNYTGSETCSADLTKTLFQYPRGENRP